MTTINYSLAILTSEDGRREHILAELEAVKSRHGITGQRVLELGCGNGRNLRIFQPDNQVFGIDGLEDAVAHLRAQGIEARAANLNLPLDEAPDSRDCVLLLDVLEHLEWPELCLRQAHRILRPGGMVIVNLPNHFTMSARLRILMGRGGVSAVGHFPTFHDWDYPHIRFFGHASAKALLECCNFSLLEDRSHAFPAVPMGHELRRMGLGALVQRLARRWPNAYASGFFLVARKA